MRVLFWGTPEFAAPALRALLGEGFDVVGVVTQPDRPRGRSRSRLVPSPIKEIALAEGLPILQPESPRAPEFLAAVKELDATASAVVAYGHILPQTLLDTPPLGTFNVHASLLPSLRGAAPIQAAIRNGLPETGITVIRLLPALDAGPMILQLATPIAADETYGELQLRLSELGAEALIEALSLLDVGAARETAQDDSLATYAPKVDREAARIDWSDTALEVSRVIRAYDPRPGAFARGPLGVGREVKLFGALVVSGAPPGAPGDVTDIGEIGLVVACGSGAVAISQIQPEGRPRMSPSEWARGRGIAVGDHLG